MIIRISLTEIGNFISSQPTAINDNFGESVELGWGVCAIGSPQSHITGKNTDQPTGPMFLYTTRIKGVVKIGVNKYF